MPGRSGTPAIAESVAGNKTPRASEKPEGSFHKSPSWRFSKADIDHKEWSVLDSHEDVVEDPSDPSGTRMLHTFSRSIDKTLLDCLKARENTTWSQLLTQSGGRRSGTNSHYIPMHELIKEAQDRATELGIIEDELLSMRLDGTHRVFGILNEGVLDIIWFDRNHKICPVSK